MLLKSCWMFPCCSLLHLEAFLRRRSQEALLCDSFHILDNITHKHFPWIIRFPISHSQIESDTLTLSPHKFNIYIRICHGLQARSLIFDHRIYFSARINVHKRPDGYVYGLWQEICIGYICLRNPLRRLIEGGWRGQAGSENTTLLSEVWWLIFWFCGFLALNFTFLQVYIRYFIIFPFKGTFFGNMVTSGSFTLSAETRPV